MTSSQSRLRSLQSLGSSMISESLYSPTLPYIPQPILKTLDKTIFADREDSHCSQYQVCNLESISDLSTVETLALLRPYLRLSKICKDFVETRNNVLLLYVEAGSRCSEQSGHKLASIAVILVEPRLIIPPTHLRRPICA